jgi:prephenate dehydrogenase
MFNQLGVIGCGLMGGSFALALKRAGLVKRVVGYSKSPTDHRARAALGVIDVVAESALLAVPGADIVLLAVPVAATEATLQGHPPPGRARHAGDGRGQHQARRGRRRAPRAARAHRLLRAGAPHRRQGSLGHPACRCRAVQRPPGDPDAAAADHAELVQKATDVWSAVGAQVLKMTPENHDAAFAAVSHLPHLLAFAYFSAVVNQPAGRDFLSLAGPGFRDFTRIAASDPTIWRDILLANREEVLKQSQRFRQALDALEHVMRSGNAEALEDLIRTPAEGRSPLAPWAPRVPGAPGNPKMAVHTPGERRPVPRSRRCPRLPYRADVRHRRSPSLLDLPPLRGASGTVRLPGSKSISNRVLLLAGLAAGTTLVHDLLDSDDTRVMLDALRALGCTLKPTARDGAAHHRPGRPAAGARGGSSSWATPAPRCARWPPRWRCWPPRRAGASSCAACRACTSGRSATWSTRCARWAARSTTWASPATRRCACSGGRRRLAWSADPRARRCLEPVPDRAAAGPAAGQAGAHDIVIEVEGELISKPYIEITLNLLARFGIDGAARGLAALHHPARQRYRTPGEIHVEGDASSASYFIALGAIAAHGGAPLRIEGVGSDSIQGDIRFVDAARPWAPGAAAARAGWRCTAAAGRCAPSRWTATTSPTPR